MNTVRKRIAGFLGNIVGLRLQDEDRVAASAACPGCNEDRVDWLVFNEQDEVRCYTCGTVYVP